MSLMGKTLYYSWRVPTHDVVYTNLSPGDIIVSDGVELDYSHSILGSFSQDLTKNTITTTYSANQGWDNFAFNGAVFEDIHDEINPIVGVFVDTNIIGFDASRVTFTADSISTNWANIDFHPGDYLTVTVSFKINRVTGTFVDDHLIGRGDEDIIGGKAGNDILKGLGDDDRLYAGAGNDKLYGGDGDDWMRSKGGNDKFWGGAGADTFVYTYGSGRDRIMDFESEIDTIDIRKWSAIDSFADLKSHAKNIDGGLWIIDGKRALIIEDFSKGDLVRGDFLI